MAVWNSKNHSLIKFVRIFLLVLIIIGIGLLFTQDKWVPPLVEEIIGNDNGSEVYNTPIYNTPTVPVSLGCFVGGCSGQICSDEPGVASTCEFRPEYACYQGAICERQKDGKCGWSDTISLSKCLDNSF